MVKILHFADAHIDMANYGRHDPQSGLPLRVLDFLKSLDTIVDTAISEKVDLVLFAGDAYKDRNPAPTYQREWGKRIMRLSRAGIPTLLLVGNHDLSPALGRANAIEEFATLEVPNVRVLDKPAFLSADDLGLPLQIIALPWISRSGIIASLEMSAGDTGKAYEALEDRLTELLNHWIEVADPTLPLVLTAHCSIQGAKYGGERTVMLGSDLVLPASLVKNPRLDYVALGHIHKPQNLNENAHPPVIYPGSIERIDFGEVDDEKYFIMAKVKLKGTQVEWRKLEGRPFIDRFLSLKPSEGQENVTDRILSTLPDAAALEGAILRLVLEYPRDWEALIDEVALRTRAAGAFEFHLVKRPQIETRIRLPENQAVGNPTPLELLDLYLRANHTPDDESEELSSLAARVIESNSNEPGN